MPENPLGLVLGCRADTGLIRHGADKLSVTAVFSLPPQKSRLFDLAAENDIELEDSLVIKRTLSNDGKSKIFINDQPISLKLLKEFGAELVEVHGQFDNQGLLNQANHLSILDNYGNYAKELLSVKNAFEKFRQFRKERMEAEKGLQAGRLEEDNLKHWVDELNKLKPVVGEEEELNRRRNEIINAEKLVESLNNAYASLAVNSNIVSSIRHAQSAISKADILVGGKYKNIEEILEQTLLNAEEAIRQIEEISSTLSYNQEEADNIEQRLFALRDAARKHQVSIDELPQKQAEMQNRLNAIELGEDGVSDLLRQEEKSRIEYLKQARLLSDCRKKNSGNS